MTALVGPSGAGKTTITSLVGRLYDTVEGEVLVGGHDVRDVTLASLHEVVGVVTQDAHMFHETIRTNLLYARPQATDAELLDALRAAQIWDLVASLPDGLDTTVGDRGYRLSGGEKQRLAIARLLLKAPDVVVLDEATAHLDSESEVAVQRALKIALEGRTSLVIAHRLSTVRDADQILVVADGRVVERGRHAQLLAAGGLYSELYRDPVRLAGEVDEYAGRGGLTGLGARSSVTAQVRVTDRPGDAGQRLGPQRRVALEVAVVGKGRAQAQGEHPGPQLPFLVDRSSVGGEQRRPGRPAEGAERQRQVQGRVGEAGVAPVDDPGRQPVRADEQVPQVQVTVHHHRLAGPAAASGSAAAITSSTARSVAEPGCQLPRPASLSRNVPRHRPPGARGAATHRVVRQVAAEVPGHGRLVQGREEAAHLGAERIAVVVGEPGVGELAARGPAGRPRTATGSRPRAGPPARAPARRAAAGRRGPAAAPARGPSAAPRPPAAGTGTPTPRRPGRPCCRSRHRAARPSRGRAAGTAPPAAAAPGPRRARARRPRRSPAAGYPAYRRGQSARIIPPSTGTIVPLTKDAAGDSRNAATRPNSAGSP